MGFGVYSRLRQAGLVLDIMGANFGNPVRFEDFATAAGLSPCSLSPAFRRSVCESACRRLGLRRIELAQKIMLLTGKSLADFALECGRSDQSPD
jgi:transcriptional regulator GlxA family with amidase domain